MTAPNINQDNRDPSAREVENAARHMDTPRPHFDGGNSDGWTKEPGSVGRFGAGEPPEPPKYEPLADGGEKSPYGDDPRMPVWASESHGKDTVVSLEAIKQFGTYVRELVPAVEQALDDVEAVEVRPGAFGAASVLATEVNAPNKLKQNTLSVLRSALNTLLDIEEAIGAIVQKYKNAEELNEADAQDVLLMMNQVNSDVKGLKLA